MKFVCDTCKKEFDSQQALSGHQRVHSNKQTLEARYAQRLAEYYLSPKLCETCGKAIPYEKKSYQRYCNHSCRAKITNKQRGTKLIRICKQCGVEFSTTHSNSKQIFCSNSCATKFKIAKKLEDWLTTGKMEKWTGGAHGGAPRSNYVVDYLLERQHNCCQMCEQPFVWYGKTLPNIMDHIDGDPTNNSPQNLRLLCPNCDAITTTWKGRNRGSGRASKGFLPPYIRVKGDKI